METLKKLFDEEGRYYRISDELKDMLLGAVVETLHIKSGETLIPYGKLDENIYIIKEGITRRVYFDGMKEKTYAFATPGTLMMSYHSYYMRLPSFYQIEACCDSVILKISKKGFQEMIKQSHEFTQWMLDLAHGQLWFYEKKASLINGTTAKERFMSLVVNRPDLLEKVPLKIIASYLGITQSSLSRLRRELPSMK